jgi:hypothetical protein
MPSVTHLNQFIAQVCVNLDALLVPYILEISASAASDLRDMVDFKCCRDQPTFGASLNQYLSVLDCRTSHIRKEYVPEDIDP